MSVQVIWTETRGLKLWSSKRRTTWGEGTRSCKFAALDGRDGKTRWTWKSGVPTDSIVGGASVALVDLDGDGTREVCVGFCDRRRSAYEGWDRCAEGNGKERMRRGLSSAA